MKPRAELRLGIAQFCAIAAMIVLVTWVSVAVLWPRLAAEYILTVRAPELERIFGFHGKYVGRAYVLTAVVKDGRLDAAGFRAGDRPSAGMCTYYGEHELAEGFFDELDRVRSGNKVVTWVLRPHTSGLEPTRLVLEPASNAAER